MIRRLRDEFTDMPGLRLTEAQAQRLCSMDASTSAAALRALVSAGFLRALDNGNYARSDIVTGSSETATKSALTGVPQPPWRRVLCLVEFESDTRESLSLASHAALRYATTLAVTHRARITALHVLPQPPLEQTLRATVAEQLRKSVRAEAWRGLIDVQVVAGTSHEELLRMATEIQADLIVLGREGDVRMVSLSRLREVLRQAPCPVLVVGPSGQAAVA